VIDCTTPPSARTGEPVIALESREHSNATTSATSSGFAGRFVDKGMLNLVERLRPR
jgi:hypothetical protein